MNKNIATIEFRNGLIIKKECIQILYDGSWARVITYNKNTDNYEECVYPADTVTEIKLAVI